MSKHAEMTAYNLGYRITELGKIINPKGDLINGYKHKNYMQFGLRLPIGVRYVSVHRLQAFQKYGDSMYAEGIVVRHFNGVSVDNSWDNILIGTQKDNMSDIPEAIRLSRAIYASSFKKKFDSVTIKIWHEENGNSYKKTMLHFSISSKGTLHHILNR